MNDEEINTLHRALFAEINYVPAFHLPKAVRSGYKSSELLIFCVLIISSD